MEPSPPADGSTADGALDAGPGDDAASGACSTTSLATACATTWVAGQFGVYCSPTWNDAIADTVHFCDTNVTQEACGAYRVLVATNVDVSYTYVYDASTGALVAAFGDLGPGLSCLGGPAGFRFPASCSTLSMHFVSVCGDAGETDAGAD